MTQAKALKPCPFCGKKPKLICHEDHPMQIGPRTWLIRCASDNDADHVAFSHETTMELAIERWNSRPPARKKGK